MSVEDIRSQIAAEWSQIAQRSQWRAYRKYIIALSNGTIADSLRPPLPPQNWAFHMPPTYADGHISATGDPIYPLHVWYRVGFSGTADRTVLFTSNKSKMAATAMLEKFQVAISPQPVVRSTSYFCSMVGFSGTADLMALFPVRTNPRWRPPPSWKNFKWPYLRNRSYISSTVHDLLI